MLTISSCTAPEKAGPYHALVIPRQECNYLTYLSCLERYVIVNFQRRRLGAGGIAGWLVHEDIEDCKNECDQQICWDLNTRVGVSRRFGDGGQVRNSIECLLLI